LQPITVFSLTNRLFASYMPVIGIGMKQN